LLLGEGGLALAYERLFEPIKIGAVQLKNRYAMAPMNLMNDWMGMVDEQEIAFNVARAMGGVGLIIYGAVLCTKLGIKVAPEYKVYRKRVINASFYKQLVKPRIPRELTVEEIENDIIGETARNCKLAVLAGFDGVEVHACHHYYLLDQFRDPNLNKRTDKYGGDADGRNRIIIETVDAVIRSVKEERADFTVGVRLSAEQWGGYTFEETKVLAKQLEALEAYGLVEYTGKGWKWKT